MIKWKRLDAGEYESADTRFYIIKGYDRIYGNHWILYDRNESDEYKGRYDERTLLDCKLKAEVI